MDVLREFQVGALRVHVLHHAAAGPVHGAWLAAELGRRGYRISPGTLYPLLARLEAAGLVTGEDTVVDGRRRRCYTTTKAGRKALRRCRKAVAELAEEVVG